jgi:hypothetical protein
MSHEDNSLINTLAVMFAVDPSPKDAGMDALNGTGSNSITVSMGGDPTPSESYFGIARQMMIAVPILMNAKPAPAIALTFISAHVLECLPKAYLSKRGRTWSNREQHDLVRLWEMAREEGLPIDNPPPKWVLDLEALHSGPDYYLRYSTGVHGIVGPVLDDMTSGLATLLETVQANL